MRVRGVLPAQGAAVLVGRAQGEDIGIVRPDASVASKAGGMAGCGEVLHGLGSEVVGKVETARNGEEEDDTPPEGGEDEEGDAGGHGVGSGVVGAGIVPAPGGEA
jgi:hypothetical protein